MALKEVKVSVTSGKKKASVRIETSAVSSMRVTIAHKKPNRNAATPSQPSMTRGRSVSWKSSIKGKSRHGSILRQPCRYYLKSTCTSPCECWHPPECQFYKTATGCRAGDKCLFPHHKVDGQSNKKPKERLRMLPIVKTVPRLGCVSQDSELSLLPKRLRYRGNADRTPTHNTHLCSAV